MIYRGFKEAARFRADFDREAGAARLQHLLDKHGHIDRTTVRRDAKSQRSPLHAAFTWDAQEALDKVQDSEADYLLRSWVTITITEDKGREEIRAAFPVVITENESRAYVSREEAFENPDYRSQVLAQALHELQSFRRKYNALQELARVFAAIEELEQAA
jgi:hypothetical protein